MRTDVYVENDSGGMSLISSSVADRVIADRRANDGQFVQAHEAVLGLLVGDDSFIARVVVNEPLTEAEQDESIGHYRWALNVPCGRLLVCGGFDPDVIGWWRDGKPRGIQDIGIPPGKYLVDVYTYLHSMNGRMILSEVWEDTLGTWFRKDHPGRLFPSWVAGELEMFPDDDPGHEEEWKNLVASVADGTLKVETTPLDWVSYLFHLQPFDPNAELTVPEEGDWFGAGQGLRRPARAPLGIPSTAEDPEYRDALQALLPKKPEPPPQAVEVFSHVHQLALVPLVGGPVAVPAADVARVYRLMWFTASFVHPELRLEGPGVATLGEHFEGEAAGALPAVEGDALLVRFPGSAGFSTLNRLTKLGAEPWSRVPAGTTLELATRSLEGGDETLGGPGYSRFRGTIRVAGNERVWEISETFPRASADEMRHALALSAAAESEGRLVLADEQEAERVHEAFNAKWSYMVYPWAKLTRQGKELIVTPPESATIHYLALAGFRVLFQATWPSEMGPEEREDIDA